MFAKLITLIRLTLSKRLILDYDMLGLQRARRLSIPKFSNYIRISNFELIVQEIIDKNVQGSVAEVGVFKGEFAKYVNAAFPDRKFYLFDTFEGFSPIDIKIERNNSFSTGDQDFTNTSVDEVLEKMPYKKNCIIKQGYFPDSLDGLEDKFCFVSLDPDLYKPIFEGLEYFYPRLNKGGYILIHDYNNNHYSGAKEAVREFCLRNNVPYVPITDTWGTVIISK